MSEERVEESLIAEKLPQWSYDAAADGGAIQREMSTDDFATALALVNRIGTLAEEANHHPDLELGWGRVGVRLCSHDVGGVTQRDVDLAQQIDALAS
ncbi:MAG: 4a-hydroxytetrahydrobiopterin dehydratase [Actinomycetota bacterium]|nr:4a-hydroxytetrahydrobiopterin dehydratase [Actinomycetota bacterium]